MPRPENANEQAAKVLRTILRLGEKHPEARKYLQFIIINSVQKIGEGVVNKARALSLHADAGPKEKLLFGQKREDGEDYL